VEAHHDGHNCAWSSVEEPEPEEIVLEKLGRRVKDDVK